MELNLVNTSFQYHDGTIYQANLVFDSSANGESIRAAVAVLESSLENESLSNMTPQRLEELGRNRIIKIVTGEAKDEVYNIDEGSISNMNGNFTLKSASDQEVQITN